MSKNPLFSLNSTMEFSKVKPNLIKEAIQYYINKENEAVEALLKIESPVWENVYQEMEIIEQDFSRLMSMISHLKGVKKEDELEDAYEECIDMLVEHSNKIGQNKDLLNTYKKLGKQNLSEERAFILKRSLKSFKDSGVDLDEDTQLKFNEISLSLSKLTNQYSRNINDAIMSWSLHIEDEDRLEGIPDSTKEAFANFAKEEEKEGFIVKLIAPYFIDIFTYAKDRKLRKDVFIGYNQLASEFDGFDNRPLLNEIVSLKNEKANLLGYKGYVELSLSNKMANSLEEIEELLLDLNNKSINKAKEEMEMLKEYALEKDGIEDFTNWDAKYYANEYKKERLDIDQEKIREYFPAEKVKNGLFWLIEELFGFTVKSEIFEDPYADNLEYYSIYNGEEKIASFLMDLYSRKKKRGGAWMSDYQSKFEHKSVKHLPIAFVVCNFQEPTESRPSLLKMEEVETLFHEMGHALHHMLTTVKEMSVSGINGVPWDAVELPSQFMEYFCLNEKVLEKISEHYKTKEKLPDSLRLKIKESNNFLSATYMVRQVELSLADIYIYRDYNKDPYDVYSEVKEITKVLPPFENGRFLNNFSHIFAGGYSVGYYGYKWADVLSADVFESFEEKGVLCKKTAKEYLDKILSQGGSKDINEMFISFKGRKPSPDAFLRHSGIID